MIDAWTEHGGDRAQSCHAQAGEIQTWLHTIMSTNAGALAFNAKVCYYAEQLNSVLARTHILTYARTHKYTGVL